MEPEVLQVILRRFPQFNAGMATAQAVYRVQFSSASIGIDYNTKHDACLVAVDPQTNVTIPRQGDSFTISTYGITVSAQAPSATLVEENNNLWEVTVPYNRASDDETSRERNFSQHPLLMPITLEASDQQIQEEVLEHFEADAAGNIQFPAVPLRVSSGSRVTEFPTISRSYRLFNIQKNVAIDQFSPDIADLVVDRTNSEAVTIAGSVYGLNSYFYKDGMAGY